MANLHRPMLACILFGIVLASNFAFADGGMWHPDGTIARQERQGAIINHENGYENLLIFVQTSRNEPDTNRVWIFPLPAEPAEINIANLKAFPSMYGTPLKQSLKDNITGLALANFFAVFPPAGLLFILGTTVYSNVASMGYDSQQGGPLVRNNGYEIWQHIDRYGIATEVMTAQDSERFYHYLEVRGTNLSEDAKQRIGEYMEKDYSFIVSWVSNPKEYLENAGNYGGYDSYGRYVQKEPIGVFTRFPSEKIFYPLKITSAYKEDYLPVTIDIIGYKETEIFTNISKETKVEYYHNNRLQYGLNEEESANRIFNNNIPQQLRFTRISINAQAKYFLQDLDFKDNSSIVANGIETLNAAWLLIAAAIFFGMSFLAAWLTNKAVLGKALNKKQLCLLALSNFLTIFGYIAAALFLKTRLGENEKPKFKRLYAIPVFWGIFFALAIAFGIIAAIISSASW